MSGERPKPRRWRALWLAAELLTAAGAIAWWWSARDDSAPRIEPRRSRATAERNVAAPPIAPEAKRSDEGAAEPPSVTPSTSVVAAASALLEADRVVVVSGVVVAADGGAPIEGAEIVVRGDVLGNEIGTADTDEQGRYEVSIEGGVPARTRVEAAAEGFSLGETRLAIDPDATDLRADLRLRKGFEVAVEVVRALDGAPIPFAFVALGRETWTRNDASDEGETDEAGRWIGRETGELPRHDFAVVVEAEGFAPRRFGPLALPDDGDRLELRCELSPPRSLTGIVVARGGGPVAGARVETASLHSDFDDRGDEAKCDDEGRFTLDAGGVPEELATLLVSADGWQSVRIDRPWTGGGGVTVVLPPPLPSWRGRVVDGATGAAISDKPILVWPIPGPGERSELFMTLAQFDRDGAFELLLTELPAGGAIDASIEVPGFAPRRIEVLLPLEGGVAPPPVIELERVVTIRCRILDAASGQPIGKASGGRPSVSVVLDRDELADGPARDLALALFRCQEVDGGAFEIEVPLSAARAAGRCSLVVEHDRRRFALGRLDLRPHLDRALPGEPVVITLDLPIDASPRPLGERK